MASKTQVISVSPGTILRIVFVILFLIFLYLIRDVIVIFLFALILASAIAPVVNLLEKIKIPRIIGALIVYILVIGLLGFLLSLIVPSIAKDVKDLSANLPGYIESLSTKFESIQNASSKYQDVINRIQKYLSGIGESLTSNALTTATNFFGGFFSFMIALVLSFYLSVQKKGVQHVISSIVPHEHRDYILSLWERSQKKLGRWLQGQLFLGVIVGVLVYIGLSFLHIKFALLLAVLAGIFEIFPYIGPVIAAVPAVILGFLQSPVLGLWVFVLYIIIQQLENYLIVPLVIGKIVKLNPVAVILALLIGGKLGGIPGMILAVPLTAVVAEFFRDLIKKRKS